MRDCVDRDPAVASPWIVKPAIAQRYGVSTVMPEETRQGVEESASGRMCLCGRACSLTGVEADGYAAAEHEFKVAPP